MAAAPALRARPAGFAVPAVACVYAVAVVFGPRTGADVLTTYSGASVGLRAADLAAGLALLAAGALAWLEPRARAAGLLALLAGVAWFGADWEGWDGGPAAARSLGALAAPLLLPLVFHVVTAYPHRRPRRRLARTAVLAAYGVAIAVVAVRALVRDPFLDAYCWRNCTANVFLVRADEGLARTLDDVWLRAEVALGILLAAVAAAGLLRAGAAGRRARWPVLAPAALVGAAEAAYALALIDNPFENPRDGVFASIFVARAVSLCLLALGLAWNVVQARRRRLVVSRLAADLGEAPPPGRLQESLAAALGDPLLRVAYWLPRSRGFVDAAGKPVEPDAAASGRALTPIRHGAEPVAVVQHDAVLVDARDLEREIGPAATLALDNERLQAEVLAQLDDLRASRARIVETADAARRRLERNLHDSAQQRLLALSYDLRLAHAAAEADGDAELTALLASAADEAQAAVGELRELAHGIYPAILAEAGLVPALESLADDAPLPVELGELPGERFDAPVETAAYVAVAEAIVDAAAREASAVRVEGRRESGHLVVAVGDDGRERTAPPVHVADRVGALGGSVEVGRAGLTVTIPCA